VSARSRLEAGLPNGGSASVSDRIWTLQVQMPLNALGDFYDNPTWATTPQDERQVIKRRPPCGCMIRNMGTLHISEAELARDLSAVLAKVEGGMEVVVERDHRPVATIRPPRRSGRPISACIASARASASSVILDGGFGRDVEQGIRERSQPWKPPSWD
jgi:antitoxin (DNA-binding transcriptional repressor) of toxin-antitoxin stability system